MHSGNLSTSRVRGGAKTPSDRTIKGREQRLSALNVFAFVRTSRKNSLGLVVKFSSRLRVISVKRY